MKKQLLVGTALFAAIGAFSQSGYAKPKPAGVASTADKLASKYSAAYRADEPVAPVAAKTSPVNGSNTEVTSVVNAENGVSAVLTPTVQWKAIAGTMNIYGMLVSQSKPLQYSDELNAVVMVHRKGTTYTTQPNSNSGSIVAHITQNWGTTWDSTCIWTDANNLARYPQGGIYNPPANTNINNAYVVGMGPVTPNGGTGWIGDWYASKQLGSANYNNTASGTPGAQQFIANTPPFGPNQAKHDFSRYAFQSTDDGAVRSMAGRYLSVSGGQPADFRGAAVVKGVFNAGVFNWVTDTLIPQTVTRTDSTKQLFGQPHQAWNEAGTIGYVMMIGARSGAINNNRGWQPIVYKTTNSGGSWALVNGIDFNSPAMSGVLDHIPAVSTNTNVTAPYFSWTEGFDMAVDAAGKLHIFSMVQGTPSQDRDSIAELYFPFTTEKYTWGHVPGNRPYLYDFVGDGTSAWTYMVVDSLSSEGPSSSSTGPGYADNPWDPDPSNSNAKVTSDSRIQCGRTPDGQFIVVTWAESDTNFTTGAKKWNTLPNLHARCIMTGTTNVISPTEPVFTKPSTPVAPIYTVNSNVANRAMFHYQSRTVLGVACPNNTVQIKVPVTISNSSPYSQLVENRLWYSTATLEFTGLSCGNVGVTQSLAYNVNSIDVYPNPAHSNATVALNLKEEAPVTVYVYNMVGQVVKSASVAGASGENKIDLSLENLTTGMYMVKVKAGNTTSIKKIIVN
jgi:hypothetical protein